jgi:hypothetical protein
MASQSFPRVAILVPRNSIGECVTKEILRIRPIHGAIVSRLHVLRPPIALNALLGVYSLFAVNTVAQSVTDPPLRLSLLLSRRIYCEHCERGTVALNRVPQVERPFAQRASASNMRL